MRLPLLVLIAVILAAGFIGSQEGKPRHRSNAVEDFKHTWNLTVGGMEMEAPEGTRLLFHHTGDLYEMRNGEWKSLAPVQAVSISDISPDADSLRMFDGLLMEHVNGRWQSRQDVTLGD